MYIPEIQRKISRFLSLLPPKSSYGNGKPPRYLKAIIPTVNTIFILALYIINVTFRIKFYYLSLDKVNLFDFMIHTLTATVTIIIVIKGAISKDADWEQMTKTSQRILKSKNSSRYLFYVINTIYFVHIICHIVVYSVITPNIYLVIVPGMFNIYIVLITILNVNNTVTSLKNELASLTAKLKIAPMALRKISFNEKNPYLVLPRFKSKYGDLKLILKRFVQIHYRIEAFSNIYGVQLLGISGIILMYVIDQVKLVIYVFNEYDVEERNFATRVLIVKTCQVCNFLVSITLKTMNCRKCVELLRYHIL